MPDNIYDLNNPDSVYAQVLSGQRKSPAGLATSGPADWMPAGAGNSAFGSAIGPNQPVQSIWTKGDVIDPTTGAFTTSKTGSTSGGTDWSTGSWDANRVGQYFQSRGVTPNPTSPDYWAQKWNEWGKSDPAYFLKRLSTADEFGGSGAVDTNGPAGAINPSSTTSGMSDKGNALYDMLMGRAQQSLNVDPNDPMIKSQVNAFDAQQQRAARNSLQALGESGGPNTNITAETRRAGERVGQNSSAFAATLMGNEVGARRTEIQNALNGMYGLITAEQATALQKELTRMTLAERGYEFDTNNQNTLNGF